jgi:hypothetical protein
LTLPVIIHSPLISKQKDDEEHKVKWKKIKVASKWNIKYTHNDL